MNNKDKEELKFLKIRNKHLLNENWKLCNKNSELRHTLILARDKILGISPAKQHWLNRGIAYDFDPACDEDDLYWDIFDAYIQGKIQHIYEYFD